jgi:hypothetical protein
MSRVLVAMWGPDAKAYVGRSMTLYRDPNVKWGGLAVGGIRISHMSDIAEAKTMALTETRANRKPFTVKPLKVAEPATAAGLAAARDVIANAGSLDELRLAWISKAMAPFREQLQTALDERKEALSRADTLTDTSPNAEEGPGDDQRGEQTTLAQAMDEIATATEVADVNRLVSFYKEALPADEDAIMQAGAAACEALLRAVG